MSAPTSHDPLVVNTQDGACWVRRAVTREGRGLYAVADAPKCCPEFVMATLAELAEHGLASMADALPMPVGAEPRTLDVVEDELTGANLALFEEELETARLRLALKSAQRGRREARARVAELEAQRQADHETWQHDLRTARSEREATAARIADLEAERHTTNEALDDAVRALRARRGDKPAETVTVRPVEDVTPQVQKLRNLLAGQRAALEDPHDGPLRHDYRLGRDLPETGGAR